PRCARTRAASSTASVTGPSTARATAASSASRTAQWSTAPPLARCRASGSSWWERRSFRPEPAPGSRAEPALRQHALEHPQRVVDPGLGRPERDAEGLGGPVDGLVPEERLAEYLPVRGR